MLDTTTALQPGPVTVTTDRAECTLASAAALARWIEAAPAGAAAIYHRGHLAANRAPGSASGEHQRTRLARLAGAALEAARQGLAHLVQRRHGPNDFAYLAIKASPPARGAAAADLRLPMAA